MSAAEILKDYADRFSDETSGALVLRPWPPTPPKSGWVRALLLRRDRLPNGDEIPAKEVQKAKFAIVDDVSVFGHDLFEYRRGPDEGYPVELRCIEGKLYTCDNDGQLRTTLAHIAAQPFAKRRLDRIMASLLTQPTVKKEES